MGIIFFIVITNMRSFSLSRVMKNSFTYYDVMYFLRLSLVTFQKTRRPHDSPRQPLVLLFWKLTVVNDLQNSRQQQEETSHLPVADGCSCILCLVSRRSIVKQEITMNPSGLRIEEKKSTDTSVHLDSKSQSSYKSTHSSRSSVLERAREYNRRIDAQQRGRAKSLERPKNGSEAGASEASSRSRRSVSAGRYPNGSNRHSTRERAMASVRKDSSSSRYQKEQQQHRGTPIQQQMSYTSTAQTQPSTPASHNHVTSGSNPHSVSRPSSTTPRSTASRQIRPSSRSAASPGNRSMKSSAVRHKVGDQPQQDAIVTPELLVDALSGHEDGLLAIAERLMEHYDSGYDVMGEAIIDAFADVQKLFQHVVEAAHMEGAAFEASRREEEITELRRQAAAAGDMAMPAMEDTNTTSPSGPNRHDEFIDQDVKDVLTEAIRKGSILRDQNKHTECFELYERACQAASSLLPVDSDHRGRLQLSIARADSMSADRACAILRYAMDDVLRSGMRAVRTPLPDPSKRADVVLSRPKAHPAMTGGSVQSGVVQSADEALASLIEEMKEILSAPVYSNTPLQAVARRFWVALTDAQKAQQKNEERLEQQLGKLKGDYLLAKAVRYINLLLSAPSLNCDNPSPLPPFSSFFGRNGRKN